MVNLLIPNNCNVNFVARQPLIPNKQALMLRRWQQFMESVFIFIIVSFYYSIFIVVYILLGQSSILLFCLHKGQFFKI